MERILAILGVLIFTGCGSGNGSEKLNPAFAGTWSGQMTLSVGGRPGATHEWVATISLPTESTLQLSPVCIDGTGSITVGGSGNSVSWSGTLICPGLGEGCTATYSSAAATLSPDGKSVEGTLSGTLSEACGFQSRDFSVSFNGTKT